MLQQFADLVPEVWKILDKTFVVYEGEPEKQLVLNYRRVEGELAEAQYHEMELPCVCDGIYAAGFILFPGERLQYYITVSERPEKILENGMLLVQEEAAEAMQGRYAWLYEMAQAQLLPGGFIGAEGADAKLPVYRVLCKTAVWNAEIGRRRYVFRTQGKRRKQTAGNGWL